MVGLPSLKTSEGYQLNYLFGLGTLGIIDSPQFRLGLRGLFSAVTRFTPNSDLNGPSTRVRAFWIASAIHSTAFGTYTSIV